MAELPGPLRAPPCRRGPPAGANRVLGGDAAAEEGAAAGGLEAGVKRQGRASGLKWEEAGAEMMTTGTEITNDALAAALVDRVEFRCEISWLFLFGPAQF